MVDPTISTNPTPTSSPPSSTLPPHPIKRWVIGLLLVAAGWGLYILGTTQDRTGLPISTVTNDQPSPTISNQNSPPVAISPLTSAGGQSNGSNQGLAHQPERTVLASGGLKLAQKSSYSCTAQAPVDWSLSSTQESNTADLYSPDKSMYAGYGIQAVNTALAGYASYYSAPLNDPDLYSSDPATVVLAYGRVIVGSLGGTSDLVFTPETNESVGDYQLRSVASTTYKGAIFYRTTGFPGDGYNYSYIEPMYFAFTPAAVWPSQGLLIAQVASSIRCTTQFQPRDQYVVSAKTGSQKNNDGNGSDAGYNPQLGTEYVHDPGTGENYLVSPSTNWSSNGPQGGGYYVPKSGGNDYIKLEPGRSD